MWPDLIRRHILILCYLLQIHNIVFSVVKWSEQNLYIHLNNVGVHISYVGVRQFIKVIAYAIGEHTC